MWVFECIQPCLGAAHAVELDLQCLSCTQNNNIVLTPKEEGITITNWDAYSHSCQFLTKGTIGYTAHKQFYTIDNLRMGFW